MSDLSPYRYQKLPRAETFALRDFIVAYRSNKPEALLQELVTVVNESALTSRPVSAQIIRDLIKDAGLAPLPSKVKTPATDRPVKRSRSDRVDIALKSLVAIHKKLEQLQDVLAGLYNGLGEKYHPIDFSPPDVLRKAASRVKVPTESIDSLEGGK